MASAVTTTDHEEIRQWAEKHGARPATVRATEGEQGDAGILRLDFAEPDGGLDEISWDDWFDRFEQRSLALLYSPNGRFNKLVRRKPA